MKEKLQSAAAWLPCLFRIEVVMVAIRDMVMVMVAILAGIQDLFLCFGTPRYSVQSKNPASTLFELRCSLWWFNHGFGAEFCDVL